MVSLESKYHPGTYVSKCDGVRHCCKHNVTLDSWDGKATSFTIKKIGGDPNGYIFNDDCVSLESEYHKTTFVSKCDGVRHCCKHNVTLDSWDGAATTFKISYVSSDVKTNYIDSESYVKLESKYHRGTFISKCDGVRHCCKHNVTLDTWDNDATTFKIKQCQQ